MSHPLCRGSLTTPQFSLCFGVLVSDCLLPVQTGVPWPLPSLSLLALRAGPRLVLGSCRAGPVGCHHLTGLAGGTGGGGWPVVSLRGGRGQVAWRQRGSGPGSLVGGANAPRPGVALRGHRWEPCSGFLSGCQLCLKDSWNLRTLSCSALGPGPHAGPGGTTQPGGRCSPRALLGSLTECLLCPVRPGAPPTGSAPGLWWCGDPLRLNSPLLHWKALPLA
uniref:Uncharacterized protein n=1 Tax=Rhinopithecus roxellana TaxID=61622 RepID=A0A2K6RUX8_RHIRO